MNREREREEILTDIARVARLLGRDTLARKEYERHGSYKLPLILRRFLRWNKAVEAAGLKPDTSRSRLSDAALEEELRRVAGVLGRAPTRIEFAAEGKHSPTLYETRFGGWRRAVAHCLGSEAAPSVAARPGRERAPLGRQALPRAHPLPTALDAAAGRRVFGAPLNFRGLQHEPVNEQGVVFVFGMVARELGFLVDAVQTGYPDCSAKERIKGGYYVPVNIEFEFKSRNFNHDPKGCDLVVCWEDDWPDCPVRVLELKSEIRKLDPNV